MATSIYDFTVKDQQGNDVSLADYRGRVLLVVNTATECGFTPTYAQLEELYRNLHDRGFDILDFPCDQFGHEAPGTDEEIAAFCTSRFGVTFPQFAKIEVSGENAEPLFSYLEQQQGFKGFDEGHELASLLEGMLAKNDPDFASSPSVKWNFTKFLVDRDGNVVRRFEPTASVPDVVAPAVEELL
ncbi:glutathione peroxidase [Gordonibacter sp. 28C]|uniref:glutathione peroxidase n=1 Tax=Gordonibacter sp. 28C TaxID=2078569 RepID=UPI000DF72C00|nr:glutathione peroxidase [Gordonibacter sp. 28C]RDB61922.1 glutathione peroxidase [Gordonibacter sp. 28C]